MCDVFSWIEDKDKKIWFMTDKDCEIYMEKHPEAGWNDVVGHGAIKKMFGVKGAECESIMRVPPEIRAAVNAGKCDNILKNHGYTGLRYTKSGKLGGAFSNRVLAFESGEMYKWVGPKTRPLLWNSLGEMDFMLDGKPHRCKVGSGETASFYDSPDPEFEWHWYGIEHIRLVKENKKKLATGAETR